MKKILKNISIIVLGLITLFILLYYGYTKYMNSLSISIQEKLVIKLYNDDNMYLVDINKFNGNYVKIHQMNNNKIYSFDNKKYIFNGKLYKENQLFIDYEFLGTWVEYFSTNSRYFITMKPFEPKCIDCNYFIIFSTENKRKRKLKMYDSNNNRLIIENIEGYILE